jgi:hypothetical protein
MTAASKAMTPAAVSSGSSDPLAGIVGFFRRFAAARRAAAAIAVDRRPAKDDLKTLDLLDLFDFRTLPH